MSTIADDWYRRSVRDVLQELGTTETGLATAEVVTRQSTHGRNELVDRGGRSKLRIVAESLQSVRHGPTPLQRRLGRLGRTLALVALMVVAIVFAVGVLGDQSSRVMLMTSLSLGCHCARRIASSGNGSSVAGCDENV